MRKDDPKKSTELLERVDARSVDSVEEGHVVFDFTGLEQTNVGDLALILTARLETEPHETVWVRCVPWKTAEALRIMRLDHLFLTYPEADGEMN
ncbi:MAG: hypothetical protein R3304_10835 [Longimicrobiales bacterium]|nr:hypothetical protein [Longimicrobiales bacterium]